MRPYLEVPGLLARTVYDDVRRRGGGLPSTANLRPPGRPPIFVVGSPRSGTTFLGECLDAVASISYHFEPPLVRACLRNLMWDRWDAGQAAWVYRLTYRTLRSLAAGGPTSRVADKTPENAFVLPFLVRTFPGAAIVHLIRDGRDVALSLAAKPWLRSSAGEGRLGATARFWVEPDRVEEFAATGDFHRCLWAWRRYTESAMLGRSLDCHYLEVRYEDLVRDSGTSGRRLLDFLEIHDDSERAAFLAAAARARTGSVGRWRTTSLSEEDAVLVDREIGALLAELGYRC